MISLSVFFWRCSLQDKWPFCLQIPIKNPFLPGIVLYVSSPPYEGLFRWRGRFRLRSVDPLEDGHRPRRVWPNRSTWTPHHALRWGSAA
ncbi:hypothetical protein M9H77_06885 [Catharanthus roseus]|uniref:Uncharacterized protein n=1 Tax=Catharanthus roseus TaxID=4058 RepID=A0ACC0BTB7_CATRO|nr:hypothetical protein M9H77_06885 [Catharanthus roseus]